MARTHDDDYETALEQERRGLDRFLRIAPHSPIPPDERLLFAGLGWFPIDRYYRIEDGLLEHQRTRAVYVEHTADGAMRRGRRVGIAWFTLHSLRCGLPAYAMGDAPPGVLMIPFRDMTSGCETAPIGRQVDARLGPGDTVMVDLNRAYHSDAVHARQLPRPPAAEGIPLRVAAGERLPYRRSTHHAALPLRSSTG